MSMLKSPDQIAMMREAGRVVANALSAVREQAAVGVSLKELDDVAAAVISDAGAKPAFLDYHPRWAAVPFPPGVICTSVNDAWCTGSPPMDTYWRTAICSASIVVPSWKLVR